MRGKVQTHIFGTETLDQYDERINAHMPKNSVSKWTSSTPTSKARSSTKIYEAHDSGDVSAALFNPAAYSSGHPGIIAAIAQVDYPFYEIHISNPYSRGGQSQVAGVSKGVITGFGLFGYYLGMKGVLDSG